MTLLAAFSAACILHCGDVVERLVPDMVIGYCTERVETMAEGKACIDALVEKVTPWLMHGCVKVECEEGEEL